MTERLCVSVHVSDRMCVSEYFKVHVSVSTGDLRPFNGQLPPPFTAEREKEKEEQKDMVLASNSRIERQGDDMKGLNEGSWWQVTCAL